MALKELLILATIGLVYSQSHCSAYEDGYNDGEDCTCADRSFNECMEPFTDVQLHVDSLAECKEECDAIANSNGDCDWFIFDQTGGQDKNCKLFGPSYESMAGYLNSCNVIGGPLRNEIDACLAEPGDPVCDNANFCPAGCQSCAGDICNAYAETECVPKEPESSTSSSIPSISICQTLMTSRGLSEIINYFTYDQRAKECRGYSSGRRSCVNTVAAQSLDIDACRA